MRAIEFNSEINNNKILIPKDIQPELKIHGNKGVRVIVLFDDSERNDDLIFRKTAQNRFLNGYSESDSIYDLQN
jgi:hypothetical protein